MKRKEKFRTRYATSLSENYLSLVSDISKRTSLKKSQVLDKGLKLVFELYENDKTKFLNLESAKPGIKKQYSTSLDKKDIIKVNIISQESGVNKNKILEKALYLADTLYREDKDKFFEL